MKGEEMGDYHKWDSEKCIRNLVGKPEEKRRFGRPKHGWISI
jgi:hypothetical protein